MLLLQLNSNPDGPYNMLLCINLTSDHLLVLCVLCP